MVSAVARACNGGLWAVPPQWGPGAKPLVRSQGQSPPEADDIFALESQLKPYKLHHILHYLCNQ